MIERKLWQCRVVPGLSHQKPGFGPAPMKKKRKYAKADRSRFLAARGSWSGHFPGWLARRDEKIAAGRLVKSLDEKVQHEECCETNCKSKNGRKDLA